MKHKSVRKALCLVAMAAAWIAWTPAVQASEKCSNVSVAGDWGFTLVGTLILPTGAVPIGATGTLSADGAGNILGTEARSVGGGFANETIAGTWVVNSDCTATFTANIYESGVLVRTSVLSAVFVDKSTKLRAVQESLTLPNGTQVPAVITGDADRLFPTD